MVITQLTGCISTGRLFALGAKGCRFKSYHSDLLLGSTWTPKKVSGWVFRVAAQYCY